MLVGIKCTLLDHLQLNLHELHAQENAKEHLNGQWRAMDHMSSPGARKVHTMPVLELMMSQCYRMFNTPELMNTLWIHETKLVYSPNALV